MKEYNFTRRKFLKLFITAGFFSLLIDAIFFAIGEYLVKYKTRSQNKKSFTNAPGTAFRTKAHVKKNKFPVYPEK